MRISNYDELEDDYSTYWKNRNYEHFCEVIALKKIFKNKGGRWFLDIGGSYGRHLPIYYSKYSSPIILDYSLNTLINNKERVLEKYPKTQFIAANAYFLPFKESMIDGAMMIRVLHHIDTPQKYFSELVRILKNDSTYVQEVPNKMNIKAVIRNSLKFNREYFSLNSYQQPTKQQFGGSTGEETVFLNYHPKYVENLFKNNGFKVNSRTGASYLRSDFLKKFIPLKLLIFKERILQSLLSFTYFSPSIFYDTVLHKGGNRKEVFKNIEDILACPKCKGKLSFKKENSTCTNCKAKYEKIAGIWDFRVQ